MTTIIRLRDKCKHGYYDAHCDTCHYFIDHDWECDGPMCPGGKERTFDQYGEDVFVEVTADE